MWSLDRDSRTSCWIQTRSRPERIGLTSSCAAWVVALTIRRSSSRLGIADVDREHEAVELGFGQRIGPFLLDRVLGGQHEERGAELVGVRAGRDLPFLHRLRAGRPASWAGCG